jgi:hypothetical protein
LLVGLLAVVISRQLYIGNYFSGDLLGQGFGVDVTS